MRKTPMKFRRRQHGLVAVEAAIIVPLLLFLMLAVAEFGRAFYQYNALNKAVRDGARYAAGFANYGTTGTIDLTQTGPGGQVLSSAIANLVVFGNALGLGDPLIPDLDVNDVGITVPGAAAGSPPEKHIRVSVNHNYVPLVGNVIPGMGVRSDVPSNFVLRASITMRVLL